MGLILFTGMVAGCVAGLIVTAIFGGLGVVITVKGAKSRVYSWWCFAVAVVVFLSLLILAVHEYPYGHVKPGSDYAIAMKNFFLKGLGYCAAPGMAAFLAAFVTWLSPKASALITQESNRPMQATRNPRV